MAASTVPTTVGVLARNRRPTPGPKPVAFASSASETIAADSTLRKIVVRLIASVQSSDRDPLHVNLS
jgi:hypothetical protein